MNALSLWVVTDEALLRIALDSDAVERSSYPVAGADESAASVLGSRLYTLRGTVLVRQGKHAKDRTVPLGDRALGWVERYLDELRENLRRLPDDGTVFLTQAGEPVSGNRLSELVSGYLAAAGHSGSCHLFRHAMATLATRTRHGSPARAARLPNRRPPRKPSCSPHSTPKASHPPEPRRLLLRDPRGLILGDHFQLHPATCLRALGSLDRPGLGRENLAAAGLSAVQVRCAQEF